MKVICPLDRKKVTVKSLIVGDGFLSPSDGNVCMVIDSVIGIEPMNIDSKNIPYIDLNLGRVYVIRQEDLVTPVDLEVRGTFKS